MCGKVCSIYLMMNSTKEDALSDVVKMLMLPRRYVLRYVLRRASLVQYYDAQGISQNLYAR